MRIFAVFLALCLALSLVSCTGAVIVNQKMYQLLMKKYTSNASEIVYHFAA